MYVDSENWMILQHQLFQSKLTHFIPSYLNINTTKILCMMECCLLTQNETNYFTGGHFHCISTRQHEAPHSVPNEHSENREPQKSVNIRTAKSAGNSTKALTARTDVIYALPIKPKSPSTSNIRTYIRTVHT